MLSDNEFGLLLEHLNRPWAGFRKVRKGVKKRLRRHMTETGCSTLEQYLTRMDRQPEVRADCERCLRVTISRFFRDRQLWQALKADVLPRLVSRFPSPLRIWSAGCAGGEEPYSLAMVWNAAALNKKPYLLATDAGEDCLQRARAGSYGPGSLKEVPAAMVSTYFYNSCILWQITFFDCINDFFTYCSTKKR
jgi:chemotaxis protein methyltransferase CheR